MRRPPLGFRPQKRMTRNKKVRQSALIYWSAPTWWVWATLPVRIAALKLHLLFYGSGLLTFLVPRWRYLLIKLIFTDGSLRIAACLWVDHWTESFIFLEQIFQLTRLSRLKSLLWNASEKWSFVICIVLLLLMSIFPKLIVWRSKNDKEKMSRLVLILDTTREYSKRRVQDR